MVVGYGKKIREAVENAVRKKKTVYKCPSCSRTSVKRQASGIWLCKKCGGKFASGSYEFNV